MKTIKATVVSSTRNGETVNETVINVPLWERLAAGVNKAASQTKKFMSDTVAPAIGQGVTTTLVYIDKGCEKFANSEVEFLKKYPGIAMVLAQDTVLKVAVAQHVKEMVNDGCVDPAESASVINS